MSIHTTSLEDDSLASENFSNCHKIISWLVFSGLNDVSTFSSVAQLHFSSLNAQTYRNKDYG